MEETLRQMQAEAEEAMRAATTQQALDEVRARYLGRKGRLRQIRQSIGQLSEDERPLVGQLCNDVQKALERVLDARQQELDGAASEIAQASETLDVTLPGRAPRIGRRHPLLDVIETTVDIFLGLGFQVAEGPEVENHYYSWDALNYPPDHPAMDEQMTFYIADDVMMRSQTSTVQIRYMQSHEPPIRVVVPGRCFRRDTVDATHCHTFHQIEGLLVDEGVTMSDLRGTLEAFARGMYGESTRVRFRPDFFPFTEPSAEFALSCAMCGGDGCRVCSNTGWLEVGGCGMVDPNVLRNVGYDPERYTGFAFGFGLERITMLRHAIDDIRLLYSGDMRFLAQF
ncbi:MAG: phenylalanine--tRNA ligase subunit alpha [Acidobacteriota bacterium]|nr:phenylalanine--tRNA ligase subunit alpha [Acidobacteriota bacterium]